MTHSRVTLRTPKNRGPRRSADTSRKATYSFSSAAVLLLPLMLSWSGPAGQPAASAADPSPVDQPASTATAAEPAARILATVNGTPVTSGDLELLLLSRKVPRELRSQVRERFLDELIDRQLIRGYLRQRKAEASTVLIDEEVQRLYRLIRRTGEEPADVLARLGHTEATLRKELSLPLAWREWLKTVLTTERMRKYFNEHKRELDGTELRASQIFLPLPAEAEQETIDEARKQLTALRAEIVAERITFADAARQHSQSPTARRGGDVGYFPFRGRMPQEFTRPVFQLQLNELSQPFRTRFGLHLVQVTGIRPGQLSLEDARSEILQQLGRVLWDETLAAERKTAEIRRTQSTPAN